MYETSFLNIWFYELMLKICVIDWQSYPSLCDTFFWVYLMIRHYGFYPKSMILHYGFYPKRMIRHYGFYPKRTIHHYVTHPMICKDVYGVLFSVPTKLESVDALWLNLFRKRRTWIELNWTNFALKFQDQLHAFDHEYF